MGTESWKQETLNGMRLSGVRKASTRCRSLLCAFSFATMFSFAAALNCTIDLSLIADYGFAQCDNGCDSCNFSLVNGGFNHGTVECLAAVPCFVDGDNCELDWTTFDGSQASALTMHIANSESPLYYAVIDAPENGGDFRIETTHCEFAMNTVNIRAIDSGVVDIVIGDDGVDDANGAEMRFMSVDATTAEELNIYLANGTQYAKGSSDSNIKCPSDGLCQWQSYGRRYDDDVAYMCVVNLLVFPGTNLILRCEDNAEACAGVLVECDDTSDSCELQYDSDWQCDGTLQLDYNGADEWQCPDPTTTSKPTTTTPEPTTESQSDRSGLVVGLILGALAVILF